MEGVVSTRAIRHAKLQSHRHHQQTNFTGQMPFLWPNQQCQSTEGNLLIEWFELLWRFRVLDWIGRSVDLFQPSRHQGADGQYWQDGSTVGPGDWTVQAGAWRSRRRDLLLRFQLRRQHHHHRSEPASLSLCWARHWQTSVTVFTVYDDTVDDLYCSYLYRGNSEVYICWLW